MVSNTAKTEKRRLIKAKKMGKKRKKMINKNGSTLSKNALFKITN